MVIVKLISELIKATLEAIGETLFLLAVLLIVCTAIFIYYFNKRK